MGTPATGTRQSPALDPLRVCCNGPKQQKRS